MMPVAVAPPYTNTGSGFSAGRDGVPGRPSESAGEMARHAVPHPIAPSAAACVSLQSSGTARARRESHTAYSEKAPLYGLLGRYGKSAPQTRVPGL
jgi:hypothetical protein